MRLFPKSNDEKQPMRKRGSPVDEKYCRHMKQPPFIPKTKVCRKQLCALPKWAVTAWTRVLIF